MKTEDWHFLEKLQNHSHHKRNSNEILVGPTFSFYQWESLFCCHLWKMCVIKQHILIFSQFISPSILEQDLGDHHWRKTSQIPSHFNPNVWLFRHGAPSQFNPGLENSLDSQSAAIPHHKKKNTVAGGRGYRSKSLPRLFSHFKLHCSDLRTITRTNSVFGKERFWNISFFRTSYRRMKCCFDKVL